jgi:hypothetical protein
LKTSAFNIVLNTAKRKILFNFFSEAIDEIDAEVEAILDSGRIDRLDPADLNYLVERGYLEKKEPELHYQPDFVIQSTPEDFRLITHRNQNSPSIIWCDLQKLALFNSTPVKIMLVDRVENFTLLQEKTALIDHYLQKKVDIEVNLSFALPFGDVLDRIFKYLLKKGWIFLNNFSFCILPEDYSGCPLGKTFQFAPDFITTVLEKMTERKYLQSLSLSKLIGANFFEYYLWHKRIPGNRAFCVFYTPGGPVSHIWDWLTCKGCVFNRRPGEIDLDIAGFKKEISNNAGGYVQAFAVEIFAGGDSE